MQNREELDPKSNNHKFAEVAYNIIKRVMDIIGSAMGLVVLSPLLLLIGICVKIESKGPMIFAHMRLGQGGKLLTV